jgi:hypothetical protein
MLPVVRRKTLRIPHGLAAIAAGICLALAFASDFQSREQKLRAELESKPTTELVISASESAGSERSAKTEVKQRTRPRHSERSRAATLLPWFPLNWNGG